MISTVVTWSKVRFALVVLPLLALLATSACAGDGDADGVALRLGYFPTITHAPAIVAIERGAYAEALPAGVSLSAIPFNAGPGAVEALLSSALDVAFIGPNPALNAYVRSRGQAVRVVAGATSGGAFLVVAPDVNSPADLRGRTVASPQLGNTQDVALRTWLRRQGLRVELSGDSEVVVTPLESARAFEALRSGQIAGAWVPEPWATRMVREAGGQVLVDERSLWPGGRYVTTHLLVRADYLQAHPDVIKALLRAHTATIDWMNAHPELAQALVNKAIGEIAGRGLAPEIISGAWANLSFTVDPIGASLERSARDAESLGLLKLEGIDVNGIYDLRLLNEVLAERGQPAVSAP